MVTWKDSIYDTEMKETTAKFGKLAEKEARRRNLFSNFIYLNYANGEQSVYEQSLTFEDLDKMLEARDKYDPQRIFQGFWRGGFKLPEKPSTKYRVRDEL